MDYQYKFSGNGYTLYRQGVPVGSALAEVALAFDKETGTLHKHGPVEVVAGWLNQAKSRFLAAGLVDMSSSLTLMAGKFDVDDLNSCLSTSGYSRQLYRRLRREQRRAG